MNKKILLFLIITITVHANILNFYKDALQTISFDDSLMLQNKLDTLNMKINEQKRFINMDISLTHSKTKAKFLPSYFNTTDFSIMNKVDIFGKSVEKIHLLKLKIKEHGYLSQIEQEHLFINLLNLITIYQENREKLSLYEKAYKNLNTLLNSTKKAQKLGVISNLELVRMTNNLTLIKTQFLQIKEVITFMKKQLRLYAPHSKIPKLSFVKVHSSLKSFLKHSPKLKLYDNKTNQSKIKIQEAKQSWKPDALIGLNKQFNNDQTANGDNYSLSVGVGFHFDNSLNKSIELKKIELLKLQSTKTTLLIKRKSQYFSYKSKYDLAKNSYFAIKKDLKDTNKIFIEIQKAYLQRFIDLNSYLQTLSEIITTKEREIDAKYQMIQNATILNYLSSGVIFHD